MLLQGLGPTAAGYAIQGGLKYGLYELFKATLVATFVPLGGALPLPPMLAAAAVAELIASTALCPYEAARIRLVADPSFAVGLGAALTRLVRENGMAGVFGCAALLIVAAMPPRVF
jgi:solute carrier family 25 phosphate transporter 3